MNGHSCFSVLVLYMAWSTCYMALMIHMHVCMWLWVDGFDHVQMRFYKNFVQYSLMATYLTVQMEKLARLQYLKKKDPKDCALLYLALNRLQVLTGLFKISKDEKDKPLVGFLSRNFQVLQHDISLLKSYYFYATYSIFSFDCLCLSFFSVFFFFLFI